MKQKFLFIFLVLFVFCTTQYFQAMKRPKRPTVGRKTSDIEKLLEIAEKERAELIGEVRLPAELTEEKKIRKEKIPPPRPEKAKPISKPKKKPSLTPRQKVRNWVLNTTKKDDEFIFFWNEFLKEFHNRTIQFEVNLNFNLKSDEFSKNFKNKKSVNGFDEFIMVLPFNKLAEFKKLKKVDISTEYLKQLKTHLRANQIKRLVHKMTSKEILKELLNRKEFSEEFKKNAGINNPENIYLNATFTLFQRPLKLDIFRKELENLIKGSFLKKETYSIKENYEKDKRTLEEKYEKIIRIKNNIFGKIDEVLEYGKTAKEKIINLAIKWTNELVEKEKEKKAHEEIKEKIAKMPKEIEEKAEREEIKKWVKDILEGFVKKEKGKKVEAEKVEPEPEPVPEEESKEKVVIMTQGKIKENLSKLGASLYAIS